VTPREKKKKEKHEFALFQAKHERRRLTGAGASSVGDYMKKNFIREVVFWQNTHLGQ